MIFKNKKMVIATILIIFAVTVAYSHFSQAFTVEEVKKLNHVSMFLAATGGRLDSVTAVGKHLYEVVVDIQGYKNIFYLTADGEFMVMGGLMDKRGNFLTQNRVENLNRIVLKWDEIDKSNFIKVTKGTGKPELIIYVDPYCPHCHRALEWLNGKQNYTLYIGIFPLNPNSIETAKKAICAQNPVQALMKPDSLKDAKLCPEAEGKLNAMIKFAQNKMKLRGTPGFVLSNGEVIAGFAQQRLEVYLNAKQ